MLSPCSYKHLIAYAVLEFFLGKRKPLGASSTLELILVGLAIVAKSLFKTKEG
jgi:hypothetical protein